jgi:hypothetical protein
VEVVLAEKQLEVVALVVLVVEGEGVVEEVLRGCVEEASSLVAQLVEVVLPACYNCTYNCMDHPPWSLTEILLAIVA